MTEQIAGIGMLLYVMPKTQADGQTVLEHAQPLSDKLIACAKENEALFNALQVLVTGTVWTSLTMEVLAIGSAILQNHGIDPMKLIKKQEASGDNSVSNVSNAA